MSYGSGVHLTLFYAVLPFPLGFQIPFSTVLSTVSAENFCSLGQNLGQRYTFVLFKKTKGCDLEDRGGRAMPRSYRKSNPVSFSKRANCLRDCSTIAITSEEMIFLTLQIIEIAVFS